MDLSLLHDVGVENDVDLTAIEGHRIPLCKRSLSAVLVGTAPVPHSDQCHSTQAPAGQGVALLDAFSYEQRYARICQQLSADRVHVERHARPGRRLVLDGPALPAYAGAVGPRLVKDHLSAWPVDGYEQSRDVPLRRPEAEPLEIRLRGDGAVPAAYRDSSIYAGFLEEHAPVRPRQPASTAHAHSPCSLASSSAWAAFSPSTTTIRSSR